MDILAAARQYLITTLTGQHNAVETRHPWRTGWEFACLHSLRVEAYTLKILAREHQPLPEAEVTRVRLAAILHDLARLEKTENHAQIGAERARTWLQVQIGPAFSANELEKVCALIAGHSNKSGPEPDFCAAVLKDADTLDEIGALSIFMAGNWLAPASPFFFHNLRQRLIEFELPFCDKKLAILNTSGAQALLLEKKAFIERFIAQIADELQADPASEQLLRDLSPATP
jgi:uncharacterized protein